MTMRKLKIFGFITFLTFSFHSNAQKADTISYAENDVRKNYAIYHLANQFNDPAVARMALYQILVYSPDQTKVLDSLALQYYSVNNYISAALVAKETLKINPNDELALELAGSSLSNIGVKDQALDYYEKLFLKNDDSNTLYQIAFMQYELKRYQESKASVDILMGRAEIDGLTLIFPKMDKKSNQEVSMRAALTNLKGLIAEAEKKKEDATNFYLEALKLAPGFEIVQANLKRLRDVKE